jgi:predicted dehydrogenase
MLRLAVLSFWHVHAEDYAREAEAHPETQVVAVWDESIERGRMEARRRGIRLYEHLDELLASPEVDGVIVTTPTTAHGNVIPAALQAGKHVFTEKVIAPTLRETERIVAESKRADVAFAVSLPRLYTGYTRRIADILRGGLLGEPTYLRVRVSHDGALRTAEHPEGWLPRHFFDPREAAGGVLTDFGCHPLYLLRHFLGMPETVSASYGHHTGREVEDNAAVTLRYPNGAIGIAEASFLGTHSPFEIVAHGTEGSLLYGTPDEKLLLRAASTGKGEWITQEPPPDGPSPFVRWVDHVGERTRATENVRAATDLSALVEASNLSATGARNIRLDSLRHAE